MSDDSRLSRIKATQVLRNEDITSQADRDARMMTKKDLFTQQQDLFMAFLKADRNYIYEFDNETIKHSEQFNKQTANLALTGFFTLIASNVLFYKQIGRHGQYPLPIKLALLTSSNLLPIGYFSYQGWQAYNEANNFLYEKYLKKNFEKTED